MKTVLRRGMRDTKTIQTLANQSVVTSRPQAVNRFARLESERARLERELETWATRKEATEQMLAKVREELSVLQQFLLQPAPGGGEPRGEPARTGRPNATSEILVEY